MPMPSAWIDKIFMKLELTYGHRFLSQWTGVDSAVIKADWSHELDGFEKHPDSIAYALKHLPTEPPTVLVFRNLCRNAPPPEFKALPAPEVDKVAAQKAVAKAIEAVKYTGDYLDPIRKLRERELKGDKTLTKFQREFWRIALKHELGAQA